ncbi:ethanolamine utilization protein EutJ [Pelagibaculum spongiae]|uniref:Ethanolamine utilization protein EutJ n=1 Tax=Pelagibaculum spongiae TaxID=2080658 RepID=A0A2V1GZH5_9GAMM|nr:ethanolamine utilization protein EutJ [Pelagibaculum spongiae]PVZ72481.1 ethanolamine utilization protein EutJ [Pelagibaculum spongiae]
MASNFDCEKVKRRIEAVEKSLEEVGEITDPSKLVVGVDLGTAYIVLVVLNENGQAVATEMQFAQVLKDGLVVDFMGAQRIVRQLKEKLEQRICEKTGRTSFELQYAAIAMPSNTAEAECKAHKYVVEACGLEIINMLDEPTAANRVLEIQNGGVIDIGGGTTGLSIFKDGKVIYTMDEPTGGTHLSLVLAGNFRIPFDEAETLKKDSSRHREIVGIVRPVIEKMGTLVKNHLVGHEVHNLYLAGGTCCLPDFENIIEKQTGVATHKPVNPFLITPLGIAISAMDAMQLKNQAAGGRV